MASGRQVIIELLSRIQLTEIKTFLIKKTKQTKSKELLDKMKNRLDIVEGFISNNIRLE